MSAWANHRFNVVSEIPKSATIPHPSRHPADDRDNVPLELARELLRHGDILRERDPALDIDVNRDVSQTPGSPG
jgi:hypothetical protein